MKPVAHAAGVIAKRRLFETLISPGIYIAMSIGLLLGYVLVSGFVHAVDSSGFDFTASSLYDLIVRVLHGAFGAAVLEKLFAEGPYLLAVLVSFSPVLMYLVSSTIFRFGFEKRVGAVELLLYGPVNGTAYFLGFVIRDVLVSILSLVFLFFFLLVSAVMSNLLLGSITIYILIFLFFLSLSFFSYGTFISSITSGSASAFILFLGIMLFFFAILMGSFSMVSGYVHSLAGVFSWIFQWISPFFYMSLAMKALYGGTPSGYLLGILSLCVVSALLLSLSSVIMKAKGVRE